jgi:hypothetical protein
LKKYQLYCKIQIILIEIYMESNFWESSFSEIFNKFLTKILNYIVFNQYEREDNS